VQYWFRASRHPSVEGGHAIDAADHRNPALSITETPQVSSGVGGVELSLRGCQAIAS
jgi:hypothetical protein